MVQVCISSCTFFYVLCLSRSKYNKVAHVPNTYLTNLIRSAPININKSGLNAFLSPHLCVCNPPPSLNLRGWFTCSPIFRDNKCPEGLVRKRISCPKIEWSIQLDIESTSTPIPTPIPTLIPIPILIPIQYPYQRQIQG